MVRFLIFFIFTSFLHAGRVEKIEYGGMTLNCESACADDLDISYKNYKTLYKLEESVFPAYIHAFTQERGIRFTIGFDLQDYGFSSTWEMDFPKEGEVLLKDPEEIRRAIGCGFVQGGRGQEYFSYASYTEFQRLAARLYQDIEFYYRIVPHSLKRFYTDYLHQLEAASFSGYRFFSVKDDKLFFYNEWQDGWLGYSEEHWIGERIELLQRILRLNDLFEEDDYVHQIQLLDETVSIINERYRQLFLYCLENDQVEGVQFKTSIENLLIGDFEEAFYQISLLIELAEEKGQTDEVLAKLYLLKGQVQSEHSLYADAVFALTSAIQKHPNLKEAYFERAVAYFELGEFDKAIQDYIASDFDKAQAAWNISLEFSTHFVAGMVQGGKASLLEFFPETLSTLRGLGKGLWAFSLHPIETSKRVAALAAVCAEYLKEATPLELLQDVVPEMKELIQNYDHLSEGEKGNLIGLAIGKYGVDILACKYSVKAMRSFLELKRANQATTLGLLTLPQTKQAMIEEARKCLAHRELVLKNNNLKIHWGKQGKHMVGHNSYADHKAKSLWEYPEEKTQELIHKFAGNGIKARSSKSHIPGTAGYHEIVNFEEVIGHVVTQSAESVPTTWGKIHYAKDGLHVVPCLWGDSW